MSKESRPYIIKIVVNGANKCEREAQEYIDAFVKLGYVPISMMHGNSFQNVSVAILFKKEA